MDRGVLQLGRFADAQESRIEAAKRTEVGRASAIQPYWWTTLHIFQSFSS